MLEDAAGIRRVVIACGYVDLRKGIDGLSMIIGDRYHQNPFEKGTLFLLIIPGISEPPARTLRATVPENERHIFR